jgi:hypothetical protein
MPVVDLIFIWLAKAASIDAVTLGGMVHPSRSGSSLVVFRNEITLSSFLSSSTVGAFTHPQSSPIAGPISGLVRFARYNAVATCVWKILASATLSSVASGVRLKRYDAAGEIRWIPVNSDKVLYHTSLWHFYNSLLMEVPCALEVWYRRLGWSPKLTVFLE